MKSLLCIVVMATAAATFSAAYAQDIQTPSVDSAQSLPTVNGSGSMSADSGQGGVVNGGQAGGGSGAELSRADVYRQLVKAEQDGQLKNLDSTVYKGN
jgi:hypothetical protein